MYAFKCEFTVAASSIDTQSGTSTTRLESEGTRVSVDFKPGEMHRRAGSENFAEIATSRESLHAYGTVANL